MNEMLVLSNTSWKRHYRDVIMSAMASQITGVLSVCSNICSGADERKHQSSVSLAFVRGIHRPPVDSPHKGPATREMCPFDDVIMLGVEDTSKEEMVGVRISESFSNRVLFMAATQKYICNTMWLKRRRRYNMITWCLSGAKMLSTIIMQTGWCISVPKCS